MQGDPRPGPSLLVLTQLQVQDSRFRVWVPHCSQVFSIDQFPSNAPGGVFPGDPHPPPAPSPDKLVYQRFHLHFRLAYLN